MTQMKIPETWEQYRAKGARIVLEAYCLIGSLRPGEKPSASAYCRGEFHYDSLVEEFPDITPSQMAHKVAARLQFPFPVRPGLWARLKWAIQGQEAA
jgi:hypothetical protein